MSDRVGNDVPSQRASKHDVELAKVRAESDQNARKFRLLSQSVRGVTVTTWIIAAWVPLQGVRAIVRDVAGKETTFNATVNITLALSVLLSISLAVSMAKSYGRKKKIENLRRRTDELERKLGIQELQVGGAR